MTRIRTTETGRFPSTRSVHEIDDDVRQVIKYLKDGYQFHATRQVFERGENECIVPGAPTLLAVGECLSRKLCRTEQEYVVLTTLGLQVRV